MFEVGRSKRSHRWFRPLIDLFRHLLPQLSCMTNCDWLTASCYGFVPAN